MTATHASISTALKCAAVPLTRQVVAAFPDAHVVLTDVGGTMARGTFQSTARWVVATDAATVAIVSYAVEGWCIVPVVDGMKRDGECADTLAECVSALRVRA